MDLNINVSQILRNNGYTASACTKDELLTSFLNKVKPLPITQNLIRLGGYGDGGYLVPDDLENVEACFSPGVSAIANFEAELAEMGIKSYMADFSVDAPPEENPYFVFEKKYLGDKNTHQHIRLEDWVESKSCDETKDLILQMDIEGSEYNVLLDTPRNVLRRFRIIVIEFHSLEMLLCQSTFNFIKQVFDKILKDFCVAHIHPNNFSPVVKHKNFEIPPILEFTFYRKDRATINDTPLDFPHLMDSKNVFDKPDITLPSCWQQNSQNPDDFLRTIKGVIHIGANTGQERFVYAQHELPVVWIEPIESVFEELKQNIASIPKNIALQYLVTETDNEACEFYISDNQGASSSILKPSGHYEIWPEVQFPTKTNLTGTTLHTILEKEGISLENYDALVMDTQGTELQIIKGIGDKISQFKYIRTEAADFEAYENCCKLQEIGKQLHQHGFKEINRVNLTKRTQGGNYYEVIYAKIIG